MDQDPDVHLRWNHHQTTLLSVFSSLLGNENLVDCTISAEGQCFKGHRVILSACSPYFELLFNQHCEKHPVVILPDVEFQVLKPLMEYMYSGEIKIPQEKLCTVLELAEALQIKGLSVTGDSETKNELRPKRRNGSAILSDQQVFRKRQRKPRFGSQVDERDNVLLPVLHNLKAECSEDDDSHLLTTNKWERDSSNSVFPEKTDEEPAMSQETKTFSESNTRVSFSNIMGETKTFSESNTRVSFSNIIGISQSSGSSKENIVKRVKLSENVLSTCLSGEKRRTSQPQVKSDERSAMDHVPEVKEEDPDDFNSNGIEEIILDDDTDESDDRDRGFDDDDSKPVGGFVRVIPDESSSGQGFCNLQEFRDPYFVEPVSLLPNQFMCNSCGRSYRYNKDLRRHMKYECGKEPQFRCPHCPARYTRKQPLRYHMVRVHFSLPGLNGSTQETSTSPFR